MEQSTLSGWRRLWIRLGERSGIAYVPPSVLALVHLPMMILCGLILYHAVGWLRSQPYVDFTVLLLLIVHIIAVAVPIIVLRQTNQYWKRKRLRWVELQAEAESRGYIFDAVLDSEEAVALTESFQLLVDYDGKEIVNAIRHSRDDWEFLICDFHYYSTHVPVSEEHERVQRLNRRTLILLKRDHWNWPAQKISRERANDWFRQSLGALVPAGFAYPMEIEARGNQLLMLFTHHFGRAKEFMELAGDAEAFLAHRPNVPGES